MENKHKILVIDGVFIVGTLAVLLGMFLYYQPVLNSHDNGARVTGAVLFSFEKADEILIDDNLDFSSPRRILAEDNLVINLEQGVYYWKVKSAGLLNSEIRQLTVNSEVALRLEESDDGYNLVNAGSVPLDVDVFNNGTLTGKVTLDVNEVSDEKADLFVGREK